MAAAPDIHATIDAIWRIEAGRVIARVARMTGDVGLAEDLAQDALVAALERWPAEGVPRNPGAWLTATAKHRAIDELRRRRTLERKQQELGRDLDEPPDPTAQVDEALDDAIGDDLLRLVFACCHPVLSREARVALTLRALGGLATPEIARAFLAPEATVAQRIVRAKRTLSERRVPFEVPDATELPVRLASVLEVVYLIFNEGYSATEGDDWTRPALCEEAMRLGRVLVSLMPEEPEVLGLLALMELQASRLAARRGPGGEPVLLADQDRSRWNRLLIARGLEGLQRAERLGRPLGPYCLQASIAACHARAATAEATDWARIAALYGALAELTPSPIVELNRAVAVSMASGPQAGLDLLDAVAGEPALARYHLLPSVRGDLLARLGRADEASAEFARAAAMTRNAAERSLLLARAGGRAPLRAEPAPRRPATP